MDGSAIWVQSIANVLSVDPRLRITIPLKAPERRSVITRQLRALKRVELIAREGEGDVEVLSPSGAVDLLEALDRRDPFDVVLIRSFEVCREAVARGLFAGRLISCYVLEPERDLDSAEHRADIARIAEGSRFVAVQSPQMRDLLLSIAPIPEACVVLLPPAIPATQRRADPNRPARRLWYTGKFHPFYRIDELIDVFVGLHRVDPALEFHLIGDKVFRPPDDPDYPPRLRTRLRSTPGITWHGALPRDDVQRELARGGVALSVWDYRHGSRTNDLVVSTKLLDYASVGLPVVLSPTAAQVALLGSDYPLYAPDGSDLTTVIRLALDDPAVYRAAAARTWEMARQFSVERVYESIRPALEEVAGVGDAR